MTNKHKSALVAAFVLASTSAVFAQHAPAPRAQVVQTPYAQAQYVQAPYAYANVSGPYAYADGYLLSPTFTQNGASRESFGGY